MRVIAGTVDLVQKMEKSPHLLYFDGYLAVWNTRNSPTHLTVQMIMDVSKFARSAAEVLNGRWLRIYHVRMRLVDEGPAKEVVETLEKYPTSGAKLKGGK